MYMVGKTQWSNMSLLITVEKGSGFIDENEIEEPIQSTNSVC